MLAHPPLECGGCGPITGEQCYWFNTENGMVHSNSGDSCTCQQTNGLSVSHHATSPEGLQLCYTRHINQLPNISIQVSIMCWPFTGNKRIPPFFWDLINVYWLMFLKYQIKGLHSIHSFPKFFSKKVNIFLYAKCSVTLTCSRTKLMYDFDIFDTCINYLQNFTVTDILYNFVRYVLSVIYLCKITVNISYP